MATVEENFKKFPVGAKAVLTNNARGEFYEHLVTVKRHTKTQIVIEYADGSEVKFRASDLRSVNGNTFSYSHLREIDDAFLKRRHLKKLDGKKNWILEKLSTTPSSENEALEDLTRSFLEVSAEIAECEKDS